MRFPCSSAEHLARWPAPGASLGSVSVRLEMRLIWLNGTGSPRARRLLSQCVPLEDPLGEQKTVRAVEPGARSVGARPAGHLVSDSAQDRLRYPDIRLPTGSGTQSLMLLERGARGADPRSQQIGNGQSRIALHQTECKQP